VTLPWSLPHRSACDGIVGVLVGSGDGVGVMMVSFALTMALLQSGTWLDG
jgi:hypothetical protein